MPPEPTNLLDFARRYTAAWCSHDAAGVASFYSSSGSLCINGGVPAVGRNAIAEAAQGFMTAFPDLQVLMDKVLIQEQNAAYHWTLLGTNTGSGGTGQRVHISGFEVWKIGDDGLIAESLGNFDEKAYQHQLEHGIVNSR
jgi:hypothetical protein